MLIFNIMLRNIYLTYSLLNFTIGNSPARSRLLLATGEGVPEDRAGSGETVQPQRSPGGTERIRLVEVLPDHLETGDGFSLGGRHEGNEVRLDPVERLRGRPPRALEGGNP